MIASATMSSTRLSPSVRPRAACLRRIFITPVMRSTAAPSVHFAPIGPIGARVEEVIDRRGILQGHREVRGHRLPVERPGVEDDILVVAAREAVAVEGPGVTGVVRDLAPQVVPTAALGLRLPAARGAAGV